MNPIVVSIGLLVCSNVFMTFAWYAHLKELNNKPWIVAALISWGIALFEYLLQVPANRIGYSELNVDYPRSDYSDSLCPILSLLFARTSEVGLFVGWIMPAWCGVFCFPQ